MGIAQLYDIEVYKESLALTSVIFALCQDEQLRKELSICYYLKRASITICAAIVEGYGQSGKQEFAKFLGSALGNCNQVMALLDVIKINFPHIETRIVHEKYQILSKRIYAFRKSLKL